MCYCLDQAEYFGVFGQRLILVLFPNIDSPRLSKGYLHNSTFGFQILNVLSQELRFISQELFTELIKILHKSIQENNEVLVKEC